MANPKHAFWRALIFTVIVFAIGLLIGFFLEDTRSNEIQTILLNSEINLLDEQIRNRGLTTLDIDCSTAKRSTFNFADDIYQEVLKLESADGASKFTRELKVVHKKYDLLRMLLWFEAIDIKNSCDEEFHTVIYLFSYGTDDVQQNAKQSAAARLLLDLKNKHGDKMLLIPIATNLDIKSVDLVKEKYSVSTIPTVIIDESQALEELPSFEELEEIIFE